MSDPVVHPGLLQAGWKTMEFVPFRDGIEILVIEEGVPRVALLRYAPGARAPRHRHPALETVLVLEGSQSDDNGHYPAGSLVLNRAGSEHAVRSEEGCVVLIQWAEPIEFLEGD